MARKKKGEIVNGWVAIDKPEGIGSTNIVGIVRRAFNAQKAGHGGTLDPLASGILPIALGEATKTVSYVMDGRKSYRFRVKWGEETATFDREGEILRRDDVRPIEADIQAVLPQFVGRISQVPPAFSAIKVDGKRAYDLARDGHEVELKPRDIDVYELVLEEATAEDATFRVDCGKGTYVRSLARGIAAALGAICHVTLLRRLACGPFHEGNAIALDNLQELGQCPTLRTFLLAVETALDDIPALAMTAQEAERLTQGQALKVSQLSEPVLVEAPVYRAMQGERVVALAHIQSGLVRVVRAFNLPHPDME